MLPAGRGFGDLSAHDETFKGLTLPFSCLADFCCEIPDLLYRVEYNSPGFDKTPFICEFVDNVGGPCTEIFRVLVDSMEMKSRFFGRVWQDMFFKVIVAQLTQNFLANITRWL